MDAAQGPGVQAAYLMSEVGGLSEAERLRLQVQALLQKELAMIVEKLPTQGDLVDLGCGSGALAAAVALARPDAQVLGCDADPLAIQEARRVYGQVPRLRFEVRALQEGPPAQGRGDLVLLRLVLMHQKEPVLALRACAPWLNPGGSLYVIEADDRCIEARPAGPWVDQTLQLMQAVQRLRGGDRRLGQDLGSHLEGAGFALQGSARTGFDLKELGKSMGPLFLPVASFYLEEGARLGLIPAEEAAVLLECWRQGFGGEFNHAHVPVFHAWATLRN